MRPKFQKSGTKEIKTVYIAWRRTLERRRMIRRLSAHFVNSPGDLFRIEKCANIEKRAEIAFKLAVAKAIDQHTRLGLPVYIWRNRRGVKLSRDETDNSKQGIVTCALTKLR
jgi:hypothetical protein